VFFLSPKKFIAGFFICMILKKYVWICNYKSNNKFIVGFLKNMFGFDGFYYDFVITNQNNKFIVGFF
jgi:hypothetical protein